MYPPDAFPQHRVVLADEDLLTRTRVSQGLRFLYPSWSVREVSSCGELTACLQNNGCDVAVSNLALEAHHTLELLSTISAAHPKLPVVTITEGVSHERALIAQPACHLGRWIFLRRPVEFPDLTRAIEDLLEESATSRVEGFHLVSFLQLMELDAKSAMLRVIAGQHRGLLYFRNGTPHYAATERARGDEALVDMLSWRRPQIRVYERHESRATNLSGNLKGLLLDACQSLDEQHLQPAGV